MARAAIRHGHPSAPPTFVAEWTPFRSSADLALRPRTARAIAVQECGPVSCASAGAHGGAHMRRIACPSSSPAPAGGRRPGRPRPRMHDRKRSAKGDAGACIRPTGDAWLADVFGFIHFDVGGRRAHRRRDRSGRRDGDRCRAARPTAGSSGSTRPSARASHNPNLANGKGLDHLVQSAGPTIVGIYIEIAGPPPGP